MDIFTQRYRQFSSPLAYIGDSYRNADFNGWQLWLHPDVMNAVSKPSRRAAGQYSSDVKELENTALLCCPEDHRCFKDCVSKKRFCASCQLPVCRHCRIALEKTRFLKLGSATIIGTVTWSAGSMRRRSRGWKNLCNTVLDWLDALLY